MVLLNITDKYIVVLRNSLCYFSIFYIFFIKVLLTHILTHSIQICYANKSLDEPVDSSKMKAHLIVEINWSASGNWVY